VAQDIYPYFAWVQPTETTFNPAVHNRWDVNLLSANLEHDEGQIPTLTVVIPNPKTGLLNPGRLVWAWYAVSIDGGTPQPVFFGRVVGLPTDIAPESMVIEVKFIARPQNYIPAKQLAVEPYRVFPYYDPVFIEPMKRDDPDTILEAVSGLVHVDRVTQAVTISDVLIGEDGTVDFTGVGDALYDSLKMHIDQSPLVAVNVKANVKWRQQFIGFFDVAYGSLETFTGEGLIAEWPHTGQNLGGGYTVSVGFAANLSGALDMIQTAGNYGYHYTWQNTMKEHHTGDTMSIDLQYSIPQLGGPIPNASGALMGNFASGLPGVGGVITYVYRKKNQIGYIIPFIEGVGPYDSAGNPDPVNLPAMNEMAWIEVPSWAEVYAMSLQYQADRQRTERIEFTLSSDVQPTLVDPLVTEDTENITLSGADVSLPILTFDNWSSVAGKPVTLGTFVFPDNPAVPGQTSAQVCIVAGTAGAVEPVFSNVAGTVTVDGTVHWSSLGDTQPSQSPPDWARSTPIALGSIMNPRPQSAVDEASLTIPGMLSFPPRLAAVSMYQLIVHGASYPGCQMIEVVAPGFLPGTVSTNSPAGLSVFTNPTGLCWWVCTTAGTTGQFRTSFPDIPGAQVTDGTVVWTNVGFLDLPVGGWPGMTGASAYFPSTRGQQSLQYLIMRARAKLRWRARVAKVTWQCPYANALPLTCRKNASIADERLPGGGCAGKVIKYTLQADGDRGIWIGSVTIGASAGNANAVQTATGVAVYVDGVFDSNEVQQWAGAVLATISDDVGFTPPVARVVDDGLVFPLTGIGDAVMDFTVGGSQAAENTAIQYAIINTNWSNWNGYTFPASAIGGTATVSQTAPNYLALEEAIDSAGQVGLWISMTLKPLNTGPYDAGYVVTVTKLMIPKTIDLEAATGP
jgi:hypothetical protein